MVREDQITASGMDIRVLDFVKIFEARAEASISFLASRPYPRGAGPKGSCGFDFFHKAKSEVALGFIHFLAHSG